MRMEGHRIPELEDGMGEREAASTDEGTSVKVGDVVRILNGFEKGKRGIVKEVSVGYCKVVKILDARAFSRVWIDLQDVEKVD